MSGPSNATSIDTAAAHMERVFPTLTSVQIERFETVGQPRSTSKDQVLVEPGDRAVPLFVILLGTVDILRVSGDAETLIVRHQAGQFTGEAAMIAGRRSLVRLRVSEPGEVLELTRDQLLALIPAWKAEFRDSEWSRTDVWSRHSNGGRDRRLARIRTHEGQLGRGQAVCKQIGRRHMDRVERSERVRRDKPVGVLFEKLGLLAAGPNVLEARSREHLDAFKYASRGRRGQRPPALSDNEWWALANTTA